MRLLLGCGLLLSLAACEIRRENEEPAAEATLSAEDPDAIVCALHGSDEFRRQCRVDRAPEGDTLYLVVRHPDGGFRRFEVLEDGRGLAAADGADEAQLAMEGGLLAVTVGDDRYRFPATIGGSGGAR